MLTYAGIDDFVWSLEKFKTKYIGDREHEFALYLGKGELTMTGNVLRCHKNAFEIGDRFRLDFDFKTKQCMAYENDKLIGSVSTKLPEQIYLCASLFWKGSSLETTRFELEQLE